MRSAKFRWLSAAVLVVLGVFAARSVMAFCAPSARSIFPASGIVGTSFGATVTGSGLTGATATVFGEPGVTANVQGTTDTTVNLNMIVDATAAPGERIIGLATAEGVVSVNFTVNAAGGPIITGIAPAAIATQGFPINFALTGQNLSGLSATNFTVSGLGVTVNSATPTGGGTGLDLSLAVAADADIGTHALVLTSPLGGAALQLYVQRPAPVVTAVSPAAGEIGTVVPVTITGSHLTGAALIITSGSGGNAGVTISNIAYPDDSTLTATLTIANTLNPETEPRQLILTSESGQVTAEFFVVAATRPSITTIRPAAGSPNQVVPVTIRGLNFTGPDITVATASANISVGNLVIVNDETATLDVTVGAGAVLNSDNTITVSSANGTANATFRVVDVGKPYYSKVRPPFANRGTQTAIVLDGVNLLNTTGITFNPASGIVVSNVQGIDANTARAILTVSPTASIGNRDLTVTTTTGTYSTNQSFRLNIPGQVPTISGVSPDTVNPNTITAITVTGSGFEGAGVSVGGAGATVSNIVVDATFTSITFDLTLAAGAAAENRPLIVVTENGTASCGVLSTAVIELSSPQLARTGSVFTALTPGYRLFVFQFSMNERFDDGPRTYVVQSATPGLTLTQLQDDGIRRATRDLPFGYVRVMGVGVTNQIGTSETHRFRR